MEHLTRVEVTFGDCDPAGIVFYPNIFRWLDKTFHDWLKTAGGHAAICEQLDAIGLGLFDTKTQFHRPLTDGDILEVTLALKIWNRKAIVLAYEGKVDGQLRFAAQETRGLFKRSSDAMFAAEVAPFREVMEAVGQG
ncbi:MULTISPECIES: acyl-CoA thioesterase [unclassified Mesorhizobium]|uniref:acyl-CoA thioesterase n=1 Tax=unclassified Mesorhizobium TaxID=325217 RepID=UPI0015E3C2E3|nr:MULTISPECIES: acyl-CoA thioesterase [unclassified Mesorhizobium]MBZ9973879.1 acyl-CoA thioesterase [Mesorhizobium sp. BR-1-1-10]